MVPPKLSQNFSVCINHLESYVSKQFMRLAASGFRAVEEFYQRYGAWEPFEGAMVAQSGKLLALKVAAIDAALARRPLGSVVVWLDSDVDVLRPLDAEFLGFARAYDVAYVPFRPGAAGFRVGWRDEAWRVESGVMIFTVSRRSRALARAAVEWYNGGAGRVRALCARPPDAAAARECSRPWLSSNVFLNDVYCWAVLLHGARRNSTVLRRALVHFGDEVVGLAQAWLPSATEPDACAGGSPEFVCPGMVCHAAPFETTRYFLHRIKSTGAYSELRRNSTTYGGAGIDGPLSTAAFDRTHPFFRQADPAYAATLASVVVELGAPGAAGLISSKREIESALQEFVGVLTDNRCRSPETKELLDEYMAESNFSAQAGRWRAWRRVGMPAVDDVEYAGSSLAKEDHAIAIPCSRNWWVDGTWAQQEQCAGSVPRRPN